jgi:chromosome segregation ATPase
VAEGLNATIISLRSAVAESEALLAEKDRGIDLVNTWLADAKAALHTEIGKVEELNRRVEHWVSENGKLKAQYAEMAAARDAAMNEITALRQLLERVQEGWEADRGEVLALLTQRRKFLEGVSRALNARARV